MSSQHTPMSLRARNADILTAFLRDGIDLSIRLFGFSMKPLLPGGSLVRFSSRVTPEVGDIVLLRFPDGSYEKLVAHRVLAIDDESVRTKGDSSWAPDPAMPRGRVLAVAVALETERIGTVTLRNPLMRRLGLLMSFVYPKLVRAYRAVWPRKDALQCAS